MDFNEFQDKRPEGGMGDETVKGQGGRDDFGFDEDRPGEDMGFSEETVAEEAPGGAVTDFEPVAQAGPAGFEEPPLRTLTPAGSTSFFGYFGKGLRMALLKGDAAEEVAADPGSFVPALVIYLFPSVLAGLALFLLPGILFNTMIPGGDAASAPPQFNAIYAFVTKISAGFVLIFPLVTLVVTLVLAGILYLFARLFKGEGGFLDYYQTLGVGSLISWGGMIPFVGTLFSLWMLPVMVVITSRVHNLSIGRSVAVVLLPLVLLVVVVIAVFSSMMMAFMGGMQGMEGMQGM